MELPVKEKLSLADDFDVLVYKVNFGKTFFEIVRDDPVGGGLFGIIEHDVAMLKARYCSFQTDDKPEMSKKRGKKILEGSVCGIEFDNIRYL